MERRKVQQVGANTYTVSLPTEWAEALDIEAGTHVDLHTHIDDLVVIQVSERASEDRPLRLAVDSISPARLEDLVRAAYAAGIETVQFTAAAELDTAQRRAVRRVVGNHCGQAVSDESGTTLTVETLLDPDEISVQQSVRQLSYVTLGALESAVATAAGVESAGSPTARDGQIDRMYALVDRHFYRALSNLEEVDALGLTRSELFGCWRTASALYRIADHADRIAAAGEDVDGSRSADRLTEVTDRAHDVIETGVDAVLHDVDAATAQRALRERDELHCDLRADRRDLLSAESVPVQLVRVIDSLERVVAFGGTIAEVGLATTIADDG